MYPVEIFPCLDFYSHTFNQAVFSVVFPHTFIYAKGNNIEITQEELEEYTERYTVMGYSENAEEMAYNDLVKRKALYQKALNNTINSWPPLYWL